MKEEEKFMRNNEKKKDKSILLQFTVSPISSVDRTTGTTRGNKRNFQFRFADFKFN